LAVDHRHFKLCSFVNLGRRNLGLKLDLFGDGDFADINLYAQSLALLALYDGTTQGQRLRTAENRQ
jgi:hypothetical protein